MPEPISILRDTVLIGDVDSDLSFISGAVSNADGTATISVRNSILGPDFLSQRILTDFVINPDGAIAVQDAVIEGERTFDIVELSNGNRVSVDRFRGEIDFAITDPQGNLISIRTIDETSVDFPNEAAVALPGGGFVVVWLDSDDRTFFGNTTLQFFTNSGTPQTGLILPGLGEGAAGRLEDQPIAVATPSGGVGVFWLEPTGNFSNDIKYAAYDADGAPTVTELELGLIVRREPPTVSFGTDGSFVLLTDLGEAMAFAGDGTPLADGPVQVLSANRTALDIARLSDGYVVAFQAGVLNDREYAVQIYSDAGEPVGTPVVFADFLSADGSVATIRDVVVVALDDNTFAVTWEQPGTFLDVTNSVAVRIFSASGEEITENRDPTILTTTDLEFDENSTEPLEIVARDVDGDALNFSIAQSDDAAFFEIDPQTGALRFSAAQDFEAPGDLDGDGVYDVSITVDDGQGGSLTVPFQVGLDNLLEFEQGGPQVSDYDQSFIFGNRNNNLFPQPLSDDFSSDLFANDFIDLGRGDDTVRAGMGDDYIIAGAGQDNYILGGSGRDIFRFGEGDEFIRIHDFAPGEDLIFLAGGLTLDDLEVQTFVRGDGGTATRFVTQSGDRLVIDGLARGLAEADLFGADSPPPENATPSLFPSFRGLETLEENSRFAGLYRVSDRNEDGLNLSVTFSGADADLIEVTAPDTSGFGVAGWLANFISAPDFERPSDADGDNIYEFTVTVTDSRGASTSEEISITIGDVDDTPPAGSNVVDEIIVGTPGDDLLSGTGSRDFILGGDGADLIRAGAQSDLIDAGAGLDYRVYGGEGADFFVFGEDSDRIRVLDFEIGVDKIILGEGVLFEDLAIRDWFEFIPLEDGSGTFVGGINVIFTDADGEENRFSIAVEDRIPDAREIGVEDFLLSRDFVFPELSEPDPFV